MAGRTKDGGQTASAGAQRPRLTRERMARAALNLIDAEGLAALTMRRLGRELGVEAMSLYAYVASKEDILDDVVELLYVEIKLPGLLNRDWDDVANELFSSLRRLLLAHPKAVPLVVTRTVRSLSALAPIELSLGNFRRAGFDREGAVDAHRILESFTLGYVMSEVGPPGTPSPERNLWGATADSVANLPVAKVPFLAELAPIAIRRDAHQQFASCLDVVLTGIKARHPYAGEDLKGPACAF